MSKNHEKKIIVDFLDHYFQTRKFQFPKSDISQNEKLIRLGILREIDGSSEIVRIEEYSTTLQEVVLELATIKLKKELPNNVSEGFEFIDEFNDAIKEEYDYQRVLSPFSLLIRGLRGYVIYLLHKRGLDVKTFLLSLDIGNHDDLSSIGRSFFGFLPLFDYSEKEVFEIIQKIWNNDSTRYDVITGLRDLPTKSVEMSNSLLEYADKNKEPAYLMTNLLIGLYNTGETTSIEKILDFLDRDVVVRLAVLGRINFKSGQDVQKTFDQIGDLEFGDLTIANQQSYLISNIIQNEKTTSIIREGAFKLYESFLKKGTVEVIKKVFEDIRFLKGYEAEKYNLLHLYITETGDFNRVANFFNEYENPAYVFDLMMRLFAAKPDYRFSTRLFDSGIRQVWNTNQDETEEHILNLFKQHAVFGMLGVKVIFSSYHGIFQVDLLKLDKVEYQLNAINSICKHSHSFDELLPLLLPLRNSKLEGVREHLQESLAKKVFSSYHGSIFNLIEASIGKNKRDKEFLKPIRDALESYRKLKELKGSINDLNPFENERDLIDLYYRLEKESHAKMMEEVTSGKGTFMEMTKNVIIVRGNSWKIGDKEVSPLGKFESSMLVDGSGFLNPDLYEHNLNLLE